MARLLLIDGSNIMFKAYYGTAYSGQLMKRSDGLYTNALYGLVNILKKAMKDSFTHVLVAFDDGKETYRHKSYEAYKAGRKKMPEEFRMQLPFIHELIEHLGFFAFQDAALEADDIIAAAAHQYYDQFDAIEIMSSDKDLYQIINAKVKIRVSNKQQSDHLFDAAMLHEKWGITPAQVPDLKGLMGDSSDNLPGIPGVGEKTALKLLQEFGDLETLYQHVNELKGKLKERLITHRDDAFRWRDMARLITDAQMPFTLDDLAYDGPKESLKSFYETMEFHSLLKRLESPKKREPLTPTNASWDTYFTEDTALSFEAFGANYHTHTPLGFGFYNAKGAAFLPYEEALSNASFLSFLRSDTVKITSDLKRLIVSLKAVDQTISEPTFDVMLAGYVLDPLSTQDHLKEMGTYFDLDLDVRYESDVYGKGAKAKIPDPIVLNAHATEKAKALYELYIDFKDRLTSHDQWQLFETIEMPLARVLADMEMTGIAIDLAALEAFNQTLLEEIHSLEEAIYFSAGEPFNIASPKQLGEILFERLGLPVIKKTKTGYSTNVDVLKKLTDAHPIIPDIMRYRTLTKLQSTYVKGLQDAAKNGRIHTIYKQALTQTGRLSSIEPNLQNLPIRTEIGQQLRKVFTSEPGHVLLASDYSQIELRLLAHYSQDPTMTEAFKSGQDIHTITAQKVFDKEMIDPAERRMAKAVNFGIIYGQSSYGLSEELGISKKEAEAFITRYYDDFGAIKDTLDGFVASAYETGYALTLMNRRRTIKELSQSNYMVRSFGERTAMNAPLQGSAADIIKKAMVDLDQALKAAHLKSRMILQIHDELVLTVPKDELDEVSKLIQTTMEHVMDLNVPLTVNMASGETLYEAK